ncbi:gamma-glutamylcyclotransferase [Thomasclavelia sp.]|uniref:gamma-glutamylcyclotransferase family protein n=1 Tax=Thomasclavelia sp. TaxID=3025757 RepID=UPI0025ECEFEF|nr:gamma-glutamylcyclotransferase family protein [Thomasclavelia sp.]
MAKIFVYGTLRKGMYNYDTYLKKEDTFRKYGYIKGSLYTIKGKVYPAFLLTGNDFVKGEIHEMSEETLMAVNKMEGYISDNNIDNEYDIIECDVYDENKEIIDHLPVYVYNTRNPNNQKLGELITCLDYVEHIKTIG